MNRRQSPPEKLHPVTAAFRKALNVGVTDRVYPGGRRPMVHRWHHSKIKGARPLSDVFIENIYDSSPIMCALLKRRPFRQHSPRPV